MARSPSPCSRATSYAQNNDYIGFKKLVYDAQFPDDDAPPMPHSSTWFSDQSTDTATSGAVAVIGSQPAAGNDELTVASERISIKCPITLLPMKDPVTSTRCPHSFEREAILSMINASELRAEGSGRRGGGQKAMQCPICTEVSISCIGCYLLIFQSYFKLSTLLTILTADAHSRRPRRQPRPRPQNPTYPSRRKRSNPRRLG